MANKCVVTMTLIRQQKLMNLECGEDNNYFDSFGKWRNCFEADFWTFWVISSFEWFFGDFGHLRAISVFLSNSNCFEAFLSNFSQIWSQIFTKSKCIQRKSLNCRGGWWFNIKISQPIDIVLKQIVLQGDFWLSFKFCSLSIEFLPQFLAVQRHFGFNCACQWSVKMRARGFNRSSEFHWPNERL